MSWFDFVERSHKGDEGAGIAFTPTILPDALPPLRQSMVLGAILALCYVCEHWPVHPHETCTYSRDLCGFMCVIVFVSALTTVRRSRTEEFLGRCASFIDSCIPFVWRDVDYHLVVSHVCLVEMPNLPSCI